MDEKLTRLLRRLIGETRTAALGTLDKGNPQVSMVPFVLLAEEPTQTPHILIHVSSLSAHTRQMQDHPHVSLMVAMNEQALDEEGVPYLPQALPRLITQATASFISRDTDEYKRGKSAYLDRFPDTEHIFSLTDFSLVRLQPEVIRFIAGFGSAHSLSLDAFASALQTQR